LYEVNQIFMHTDTGKNIGRSSVCSRHQAHASSAHFGDKFQRTSDDLTAQCEILLTATFESATSGPAEFLGRNAERGTIQAGKRADLVLLDANPLDDIRNTQKIRAVVLNGKLLPRNDLDGVLAGVERFAAKH
jgi:cytosine/adenosine deaminase-related metal-dependent hydrolase